MSATRTSVPPQPVAAPPVTRMAIAVLALIGLLISLYMSLYKLGFIPEIACGDGGCSLVQNSPWAVFLGVPVPFLGLAGYGLLLGAALLGLQPERAGDRRIAAILLLGGAVGFGYSMYLTYLEATVIHAWCRWCIVSAVIATLILLCALPEIRKVGANR